VNIALERDLVPREELFGEKAVDVLGVGPRQRGDARVPRRVAVHLVQAEEVVGIVDPVGVLRQPTDDRLHEEGNVEWRPLAEEREVGRRLGRDLPLPLARRGLVLTCEESFRRRAG
jgi:hypothetical protein